MPRFHKAISDIAIKSAKNGGPTTSDILTAMVAGHEDQIESAEKLAVELKATREHNEEAHKEILGVIQTTMDNHLDFHLGAKGLAPRNPDDPPDSQFLETRQSAFPETERTMQEVVMGWRAGKWLLALFVVVAVGWVLPYWADSCASQRAERATIAHEEHILTPSPTP